VALACAAGEGLRDPERTAGGHYEIGAALRSWPDGRKNSSFRGGGLSSSIRGLVQAVGLCRQAVGGHV
jgi:hypothetical protein